MTFLNNLSVKYKIALIIIMFSTLIIILEVLSLADMRKQLETSKAEQSRAIVSSASNIAKHFHQQYKNGLVSEQQAKSAALAAIAAIRYEGQNYVFITDLSTRMLSHPIKPALNGNNMSNTQDANGVSIFVEFVSIANNKGQGSLKYLWPKPGYSTPIDKISYVKLFKEWGWILGTGVYTDDIDQIYFDKALHSIALFLLALPIILFVSIAIYRNITRPIAEISQVMQRLAKGDFTAIVTHTGEDEIGHLAANLNSTTTALSKLILQVEDSCSLIRESTQSSATTTVQTFDGISRQKDQTTALAAAVNEMSMSAHEVAQTAITTADHSRSADAAALQGKDIVETTIDKINQVSTQMGSLLTMMARLEKDTEKVETILNVISDISDQTNLLALNAAIEAARAGDQGRGFAVVADEVRQLAKRTQESTGKIRELNDHLKSSFSNAVIMVKKGHEFTQQCTDSARDAGEHINSISVKVNEILQMSDKVAIAVEQQSLVAEEINQSISTISVIAEETSLGANATAAASETLSSMSMQLETHLQEFRI